ncbi:MAG: hypothetical protein H7A23_20720 [Leptospiraceae bacterium]|nr:hypothetical protein [Leptospiraceae bacterium]
MKSLLCILLVALTFHNCKTEKSSAEKMGELFLNLVLIDSYLWVNVCPAKNATLTQGTHTITLSEGEEYWFDVSTNSEPYDSYLLAYDIGITESSGQTLSIGNSSCIRNQQIFNPSQAKAEGEEGYYTYKDGVKTYNLIFKNRIAGIKSTSGSGDIVIKVP